MPFSNNVASGSYMRKCEYLKLPNFITPTITIKLQNTFEWKQREFKSHQLFLCWDYIYCILLFCMIAISPLITVSSVITSAWFGGLVFNESLKSWPTAINHVRHHNNLHVSFATQQLPYQDKAPKAVPASAHRHPVLKLGSSPSNEWQVREVTVVIAMNLGKYINIMTKESTYPESQIIVVIVSTSTEHNEIERRDFLRVIILGKERSQNIGIKMRAIREEISLWGPDILRSIKLRTKGTINGAIRR